MVRERNARWRGRGMAGVLWCGALAACGGGGGDDAASVSAATLDAPAPATTPGASPATDALAATAALAPTASLPATVSWCGNMAELLAHINAMRASARVCVSGRQPAVAPLVWNAALALAAERHAIDLAAHERFSHLGSDGSTLAERVSAAGLAWSALGENIAAGQTSAGAAVQAWMASAAGHCEVLMSASFTQLGASCAVREGGSYGNTWVMDVAR